MKSQNILTSIVVKHDISKGELSVLVANDVKYLLNITIPSMRKPGVTLAANLAGTIVAAIAGLPRREQYALAERGHELTSAIVDALGIATNIAPNDGSRSELRQPLSRPSGSGVAQLHDWAGEIAGPTELERTLGIARSTLYRWQKMKLVIALRTGGRKFVFPTAQFVDGRPAFGLREILGFFPDARLAWYWLVNPSPLLSGKIPLDLLRIEQTDEVLRAAQEQMKPGV
jgi:hypothetical protein